MSSIYDDTEQVDFPMYDMDQEQEIPEKFGVFSDADKDELRKWHASDMNLICPVCNLERGKHFDGWCPTKNNETPYKDDKIDLSLVRGRFGRPVNIKSNTGNKSNNSSSSAVNDYTCPTCKNDRCSKSEKICWMCGNIL